MTGLDDALAAAMEARVLARAAGQTTTGLRAAARRAVLAPDPAGARSRRGGTPGSSGGPSTPEPPGLVGRDLPPAGVLAADQHLSEQARRLRSAGLPGTLDQLRARAFLALLAGQPVITLPPAGADPGEQPGIPGRCGGPGSRGGPGGGDGPGGRGVSGNGGGPGNGGVSGNRGVSGGRGVPGDNGAPLAGTVNLIMPLAPLCRRHHQAKQAPGWHLDQPSPGVLTWTTPTGRTYTTRATTYPA